jgi:hypothetical protein
MSQVYEQIFGRLKSSQITIATDGDVYLLQVRMAPAACLAKLLVQQASGTNVAFKVDVLNSNCGQTSGELPASAFPAGGVWQTALVIPQQRGTSGQQLGLFIPWATPSAVPPRLHVNSNAVDQFTDR